MKDLKIAVYTAITNGRDSLKESQIFDGADFFVFTDDLGLKSNNWQVLPALNLFNDPVRDAKIFKILPHIFFPDYDYTLWIDASVELKTPVETLIANYLSENNLAVFKHCGGYDCIYNEADICKSMDLDSHSVIDSQMDRYRKEGFPKKFGLAECTILLRKNDPTINAFNEKWWAEISSGSRRDQLSFNYVVWKTGLVYTYFPGQVQYDPLHPLKNGNPHFSWNKHLKKTLSL